MKYLLINEKISKEYEYKDNIHKKEVIGISLKDFEKMRIFEQIKIAQSISKNPILIIKNMQ